jgi:hypothetical protein
LLGSVAELAGGLLLSVSLMTVFGLIRPRGSERQRGAAWEGRQGSDSFERREIGAGGWGWTKDYWSLEVGGASGLRGLELKQAEDQQEAKRVQIVRSC